MNRIRLLIVDDELIVARAIGRLLALEHSVTVVYSAADALVRLEKGERFDAILSDVSMPDLDGMAFYEKVYALAPDQAKGFIFLTGGHISPAMERFLDRYHPPWIGKPFSPTRLKELINGRLSARTLSASSL